MTFDEAAAALALIIGSATAFVILLCWLKKDDNIDFTSLMFIMLFLGAVIAIPLYATFIGLHAVIKTW